MPNNYNVRTVTRPAKPRSKALQGLSGGASSSGASYAGRLTGYVTIDTEQTITAPKTFAEDVTFGAAREDGTYSKLLIPSTSGPGIYDLYVSTEPVDGEVPSASGGIDEDELWTILGGSSTNKVIDPSHIPVIPVEKVSGLSTALSSYATQEWVEGKGYLTSVSLSTISDLHASWDSLLQSAPDFYSKGSVYSKSEADGRYVGIANQQTITGKKTFDKLLTASAGLSGTNADLSGYLCATKLYLPFSGGNKVYDILISTQPIDGEAPSEGGGINEDELWSILGGSGTQKIGASHIPPLSELSGNLDSSRITGLDSALTGYVKKAGDTMTGMLQISATNTPFAIDSSNSIETAIQIKRKGTYKAVFGYYDGLGAFMYNWSFGYYLNLTDGGGLQLSTKTNTIANFWHSGNDGSGSGLDADLLDGYHQSSFLRSRNANNVDFNTVTESGVYRLSYTTSNGASNGPSGSEWGNMLVLRGGGDTIAQLAFGYTSSDRPKYRQGNPSNVGGSGSWTQWFTLATTLDNVYSATKLQTSRTLWGQSFNGTANVDGCLHIHPKTSENSYNEGIRIHPNNGWTTILLCGTDNTGNSGTSANTWSLHGYQGNFYINRNAANSSTGYVLCNIGGNWGIGTTSPAYKLDVAGEIRTTLGITIGSTGDYGWYISSNRITCGIVTARGCNVGSLLVSSAWADYTKVPTNGIYCKGNIWTGGKLFIPSSSGNNVFDAYIA